MTVWIHEYSFYTLCYNLILLDFVAHMVPAVAVGTLPHFLVQQGIPDSSCAVPILATVSAISTRNSGFFQWRRVFKNQDLGTRYTHRYWEVIIPRPSQWIELGYRYTYVRKRS